MNLPTSQINGNGFAADLNVVVTGGNPDAVAISSAEIDGQFFGPSGQEIGAHIWGEGTLGQKPMLLQGIALAKE